ncbi:MAG: hypothetical protein OXC07_05540 [Kistimonas sp.]|nr:hypothetical protein [Kistimonas sp.]
MNTDESKRSFALSHWKHIKLATEARQNLPFIAGLLLSVLPTTHSGAGEPPPPAARHDRVSWVIPSAWEPLSNRAGVYGPPASLEKFEVIYTGRDGVPPTGFRYTFSSPELKRIRSRALRCILVTLACDKQKFLVARIEQGQAEIDSRHNHSSDVDWIADTLCHARPPVGYLSLRILPPHKKGSPVCNLGKAKSDQTHGYKTYIFGVYRARAAILQAQRNWDKG